MSVSAVYRGYQSELVYNAGYTSRASASSQLQVESQNAAENRKRDDIQIQHDERLSGQHLQRLSVQIWASGLEFAVPTMVAQEILARQKIDFARQKGLESQRSQPFESSLNTNHKAVVALDRLVQSGHGKAMEDQEIVAEGTDTNLYGESISVESDNVVMADEMVLFEQDQLAVDKALIEGAPTGADIYEPKSTLDPLQQALNQPDFSMPFLANHRNEDPEHATKRFRYLDLEFGYVAPSLGEPQGGQVAQADKASLSMKKSARNFDRDVIRPYHAFKMPQREKTRAENRLRIFNPENQRQEEININRSAQPFRVVNPTTFTLMRDPIPVGVQAHDVFRLKSGSYLMGTESRERRLMGLTPYTVGMKPKRVELSTEPKTVGYRLSFRERLPVQLAGAVESRSVDSDIRYQGAFTDRWNENVRMEQGDPYDQSRDFRRRVTARNFPDHSIEREAQRDAEINVEHPPDLFDAKVNKTVESTLYGRNWPEVTDVQRLVERVDIKREDRRVQFQEPTRFPYYGAHGNFAPNPLDRGALIDSVVWGWARRK